MRTKDLDIVYVLRDDRENSEFRYSLRSLTNLPHSRVWVYGACPSWAMGVFHQPTIQQGVKWKNTSDMLYRMAFNEHLSDNFIYFNDDFFIMHPIDELEYYYTGTLGERADSVKVRSGAIMYYSRYGQQLKACEEHLKRNKLDTLNYELHIPMIFNRKKLASCIKKLPDRGFGARRSLYGNTYEIGGTERGDCKYYEITDKLNPKDTFASTTNMTFKHGLVGKQIREKFKEKCEYER